MICGKNVGAWVTKVSYSKNKKSVFQEEKNKPVGAV
jgi:hypothetical protein